MTIGYSLLFTYAFVGVLAAILFYSAVDYQAKEDLKTGKIDKETAETLLNNKKLYCVLVAFTFPLVYLYDGLKYIMVKLMSSIEKIFKQKEGNNKK